MVTLFKFDSAKDVVSENGVINSTTLEGPLKGKQISDLESIMTNGTAYANIHTEKNPNGEIRGQNRKFKFNLLKFFKTVR